MIDSDELRDRENQRAIVRDAVRQVLAEQEPLEGTMREVFREAINEWINDKFREFGKWSIKGLAALAFGLLIYLVLVQHGWTPPHK